MELHYAWGNALTVRLGGTLHPNVVMVDEKMKFNTRITGEASEGGKVFFGPTYWWSAPPFGRSVEMPSPCTGDDCDCWAEPSHTTNVPGIVSYYAHALPGWKFDHWEGPISLPGPLLKYSYSITGINPQVAESGINYAVFKRKIQATLDVQVESNVAPQHDENSKPIGYVEMEPYRKYFPALGNEVFLAAKLDSSCCDLAQFDGWETDATVLYPSPPSEANLKTSPFIRVRLDKEYQTVTAKFKAGSSSSVLCNWPQDDPPPEQCDCIPDGRDLLRSMYKNRNISDGKYSPRPECGELVTDIPGHPQEYQNPGNFTYEDLSCNHGSLSCSHPHWQWDGGVSEIFQNVRDEYGQAINVTSAYRCPIKNRSIDSASTSNHAYGHAFDFHNGDTADWDIAIAAERAGYRADRILLYHGPKIFKSLETIRTLTITIPPNPQDAYVYRRPAEWSGYTNGHCDDGYGKP